MLYDDDDGIYVVVKAYWEDSWVDLKKLLTSPDTDHPIACEAFRKYQQSLGSTDRKRVDKMLKDTGIDAILDSIEDAEGEGAGAGAGGSALKYVMIRTCLHACQPAYHLASLVNNRACLLHQGRRAVACGRHQGREAG